MPNYTIFHLHSDLSSCVTSIDSVTKYDEYIERAKECGMKALAFSEHGSVFSWIKKKEHIEAAGMKYIHAEEFYITKTLDEKIRDNRHCVLIAKNYDGVLELNRLSSIAFNRNDNHFYYMPRISLDELIATSDNIIISTACLASPLNSDDKETREKFFDFLVKNKHRCFLEIQHHNVAEQKRYNIILNKISKEYDIPLVVGTDTHALNDEHMEARAIMQKAKNVRFENEDYWDLTFKTYDELVEAYKKQNALPMDVVLEAIENTNKIADMIEEFELDRSYKYPHLWDNPEELFMKKIKEGIKKRGVDKYPNRQEYADRVRYELEAYKHNQAIDFMLLMEDICSWCREQDIQVGYGRGSVNGSIIAWLLGITEMDSIKHKLNFDRFLNVERVSLSDVDTDFPPSRIEDVKQYLFNKHGLHCCDIVTFNTIADKGAIRDVGRALEMPLSLVDSICETVDDEEKYQEMRERYPELFKYVDMVKGVVVSYGNHPCGTVVCEFTLDDSMGLCSSSTDPYPISQIYMKEIDSLNYVKLDLLKLDTIELIYNTCKMANIPMVTPDNLDITDEKVWDSIRDDTTQIFQWEGATGDQYIKRLFKKENLEKFKEVNPDFNQMTLMSIGNSAIRPAGASYREELARGVIRSTGSKAIDEFLKDTMGYLTFQEQIIFFLHLYCGFTMGEADVVRRCVDENTLITMSNGKRKRIKDIEIGDSVMTLDENNDIFTYNVVKKVYDNGKKDTIKISTKHEHSLCVTKNHFVLTQRGWIKAGELTTDDYIMTPLKNHGECDGLTPNKRLQCSDMFLIGILLGDGSIGTEKPSDLHFTNSDIKLIGKFKECVNKRLRDQKTACEFYISDIDGKYVDKIYIIRIKSKNYRDSVWKNLIVKYDLNKKSAGKHIPIEMMLYPDGEKLHSLLAGLFSTDGGVINSAKVFEYYTISNELAYDIQYLLGKCGIYSYVYSGSVNGYDCISYKVRISQKDAINTFATKILPLMVGNKQNEFESIVKERNENSETCTSIRFNYLLPKIYLDEILYNSEIRGMSLRSAGLETGIKNFNSLSDVKAWRLVKQIYAPQTYRLLMSEYMPLKIISIENVGKAHVYDLEIDQNHNYIAEGLIVHNCFAKKLGTQDWLPIIKNGGESLANNKRHIDGFIKTMKDKYNIPEEKSEQDITAFLQVIEDASEYLFSLNHSQPYSYMGYASGWLRYYYPVEFLTCALNINADNQEKTTAITEYASKVGVTISSIRFGYSQGDYSCDPETKIIYKGLSSIKYLGNDLADELYELGKRDYTDFIDLLQAIDETSCDSRQLDILIKLEFFKEFGSINMLLKQVEIYSNLKGRKQIKLADLSKYNIPLDLIQRLAQKQTVKMFKDFDWVELIREMCKLIPEQKTSIVDILKWEQEYLGYMTKTLPNVPITVYMVMDIDQKYKHPVLTLYRLYDKRVRKIKVKIDTFDRNPLQKYNVINIDQERPEKKWRMIDGKWSQIDEYEDILKKYTKKI